MQKSQEANYMKNDMIKASDYGEMTNAAVDIFKFIMALLVVGIHTEPFSFNPWLDRGFGMLTRLCVPFFFMTSAYFYWINEKGALKYLKRLLILYLVWSVIYIVSAY